MRWHEQYKSEMGLWNKYNSISISALHVPHCNQSHFSEWFGFAKQQLFVIFRLIIIVLDANIITMVINNEYKKNTHTITSTVNDQYGHICANLILIFTTQYSPHRTLPSINIQHLRFRTPIIIRICGRVRAVMYTHKY